ncbi:ABC transporter ATP-binding protein [Streptomyces sp. NPDC000987]|uniref:ABC transporter ATP-binding protein n=1 Tax=Streptomyces sp. NPDC000987 TaxID=3154374 RepID=UPI003323F462
MSIVEVTRMTRTYRTRTGAFWRRRQETEAVRGVSFHIEPGEMFGLLGPNGAGKTTTIKILTTLLLPTSGTVKVLGFDVATHPTEVRKRIGYVFGGDRGLYDRLSAYDNLRYFAELYGVPAREQRRRIDRLLEMVDLSDRRHERVEGFSRGMRQRLHIARGLLHDPEIVFLDEPSIGIDPVGARKLRGTVAALAAEKKTVLLTTHYMYEADELCDRIAIIRDGSLVAEGTPLELKSRVSQGKVLEVTVYGSSKTAAERVRALDGVRAVTVEDRDQAQVVLIRTAPAAEVTSAVLEAFDSLPVRGVLTREPTLEDAYVELVDGA